MIIMIIIGITGTLGSGKGTIVKYLVEQKGFEHYTVRGFLTEALKKRNMAVNRDTMTSLANELRKQNSPSYIVEKLAEKALKSGNDCVIESIRTPGEVAALRKYPKFVLLAVDADINLRYQRILKRNSETDQVSFETFVANEKREMHSDDPNKQNLSKCIEMADYTILNNDSINSLHSKVETFLNNISYDSQT